MRRQVKLVVGLFTVGLLLSCSAGILYSDGPSYEQTVAR